MKTFLRTLILVAACFALAASAPVVQVQTTMLGCNPGWNADGTLASANVQAMFTTTTVVDDQTFSRQSSVNWDGTSKTNTVVYNGQTYTYYEATMVIAAIAAQERIKAPGTQAKAAEDKAIADAAAAKAAADAAAQPTSNP